MEILGAYAGACGAGAEKTGEILECVSCDEALRILKETGKDQEVLGMLMKRIAFHLQTKAGDNMEIGAITFSKVYGELGRTPNAGILLRKCGS